MPFNAYYLKLTAVQTCVSYATITYSVLCRISTNYNAFSAFVISNTKGATTAKLALVHI